MSNKNFGIPEMIMIFVFIIVVFIIYQKSVYENNKNNYYSDVTTMLNYRVNSEDEIKAKFVIDKIEKCINSRLNFYYREKYSPDEAIFDCQKKYVLGNKNSIIAKKRNEELKSVGLTGIKGVNNANIK